MQNKLCYKSHCCAGAGNNTRCVYPAVSWAKYAARVTEVGKGSTFSYRDKEIIVLPPCLSAVGILEGRWAATSCTGATEYQAKELSCTA